MQAEGLPWGLRLLEISAAVRAQPRILGVWGAGVRELDESLA
jgi:hypothetical protein